MSGGDQLGGAQVVLDVVVQQRVEDRRSRAASRCRAGPGRSSALGGLVIEFSGIGGVSPRPGAPGVAPPGQLPDQRLEHVLDRREAAGRVAVEGRVAGGQLALVAGGQDQVAVLVGQRHQRACRGPGPAGSPRPGRSRSSSRLDSASTIGSIGTRPGVDALALARSRGVVDGVVRGVAARHRAPRAPGPGRARRRRSSRRAPSRCRRRGPSDDGAEAVLADVVADAEDQRRVDLGAVVQRARRALAAAARQSGGPGRVGRGPAARRIIVVPSLASTGPAGRAAVARQVQVGDQQGLGELRRAGQQLPRRRRPGSSRRRRPARPGRRPC